MLDFVEQDIELHAHTHINSVQKIRPVQRYHPNAMFVGAKWIGPNLPFDRAVFHAVSFAYASTGFVLWKSATHEHRAREAVQRSVPPIPPGLGQFAQF